jgi:hypothetical protein
MEVDHQSAAAAAAASAGSTAMDVDHGSTSQGGDVEAAIALIEKDKKTSEAVLKNLSKMLSSLKKSPNLLANRKFRCDNIAVKKFVVDVPGALDLVKQAGYQMVELTDKKTPYLVIEEAYLATPEAKARLDTILAAITNKLAEYEAAATAGPEGAAAKPAGAPAVPTMCLGGCGFHGSADTEGCEWSRNSRCRHCFLRSCAHVLSRFGSPLPFLDCSVCFKKKFLHAGAAATASSPNKPASSGLPKHTDPFVTPPKASMASTAAASSSAAKPAAAGGASMSLSAASNGEMKCLKHCGRVGIPKFNGFCEPCFAKLTEAGRKPPPPRWKCLFDGAMVKVRAIVRFNRGKKPIQTNKSRCWTCSKKVSRDSTLCSIAALKLSGRFAHLSAPCCSLTYQDRHPRVRVQVSVLLLQPAQVHGAA